MLKNSVEMNRGVVCLLACLLSCSCFAQVKIGIKGGGNLCHTYKLLNSDYEYYRLGFYTGAVVKVAVTKKIFLQPELQYSSKGCRYLFYMDEKTALRLNYLSLPILLNYQIGKKFSAGIGPEVSYLLNAKEHFPTKETVDRSERFPVKYDIGIDANISYGVIRNLNVDLRYYYGFRTYYYTDAVGVRVGESRGGNIALQLGLTYFFH